MQTRQIKSHSPDAAAKDAETSNKASISAAVATRIPAWANSWEKPPTPELFLTSEAAKQGQVTVLEPPQQQERSDTPEKKAASTPPPFPAEEKGDAQEAGSVSQDIIRRLQSDPEDRAGAVKRLLTTLKPATLKIALDQAQGIISPATLKSLSQSLSEPTAPEAESPQTGAKAIPSSPISSASKTTPTTSLSQEQKVTTTQRQATAQPIKPMEKAAPEAQVKQAEGVLPTTGAKPEAKPSTADIISTAPRPLVPAVESAPAEKGKATPQKEEGLAAPGLSEGELPPGEVMAVARPAAMPAPAGEAMTQKPPTTPGNQVTSEGAIPSAGAYPATSTDVTPMGAKPEAMTSEPAAVPLGEVTAATGPTAETAMAPEKEGQSAETTMGTGDTATEDITPVGETAAPETTTTTEPSADTGPSGEPAVVGPATGMETPAISEEAGETGAAPESAAETPAEPTAAAAAPATQAPVEQAGTEEAPTPEGAALGETTSTTASPAEQAEEGAAPMGGAEVSEKATAPEMSTGAAATPASETSMPEAETTTAPQTSAAGAASAMTPVPETAAASGAKVLTSPAGTEDSTSTGETAEQDAGASTELARATENAETEAAPAASGTLESGERESLLASVAHAPVDQSAGGGSEGAAGESGGGKPITEPPQPQIPDVSQAQPTQALAKVSSLPPAQLQAALKGVSAATTRSVAAQRAGLATNPPQMERPSGAPLVNASEEQAKQLAQAEAATGKSSKQRATAAHKQTGKGKSQVVPSVSSAHSAPPPPVAAVPVPKITGDAEGKVTPAEATQLKSALHSLPTTDPGLEVPAATPPQLSLDGDANPANVQSQHIQLERDVSEAHQQGQQDAVQPMGEGHIYPDVPKETLRANVSSGGGTGTAGPATAASANGMAPSSAAVSSEDTVASIIAQEQKGAEIRAAAAQAQAGMITQQQDHAEKVSQERADSQRKIDEMVTQNTQAQEKQRSDAQSEAQQQREQWSDAQNRLVEEGRGDAQQKVDDGMQAVTQEKEKGEREAAGHIEDGNRKVEDERGRAEQQARTERKNAEKESEQDDGIFSWLSSKVTGFFDRIKQGIQRIFDEARKVVKGLIDVAKQLAAKAIDAARQFIVDKIRDVGNALIAIGDRVLAGFPGLRNRFRNAIKKTVSVATAVVNKLADELKKDVQKALDLLGKGLDAALGLLEKGLLAYVDGLNKVVQGAISFAKGVVEMLGVFATIIKDLASHPLQWLSNLGAAVKDGIRNYLWQAFKEAVKEWFNQKLEEVLGLGLTIWNILKNGGISLKEIGTMAWEAIKEAIPAALIQILIEKLVSMIVPAAGAIMTIIEGLQAAWGTIKRIIAAIQAFVDFLKAVKSGNAGPQFAKMLAAAAVAVIDFVANWLIKRLRKPSGGVASRIRAIAQRIGAGLKKVGKAIVTGVKKVVQIVKKAGKAAWQGIKKGAKKVFGALKKAGKWVLKKMGKVGQKIEQGLKKIGQKIKSGVQKVKDWWKKKRGTKEERQDKARKKTVAILNKALSLGVPMLVLKATVRGLKALYGWRELEIRKNESDESFEIYGGFSPGSPLAKGKVSVKLVPVTFEEHKIGERKRKEALESGKNWEYATKPYIEGGVLPNEEGKKFLPVTETLKKELEQAGRVELGHQKTIRQGPLKRIPDWYAEVFTKDASGKEEVSEIHFIEQTLVCHFEAHSVMARHKQVQIPGTVWADLRKHPGAKIKYHIIAPDEPSPFTKRFLEEQLSAIFPDIEIDWRIILPPSKSKKP